MVCFSSTQAEPSCSPAVSQATGKMAFEILAQLCWTFPAVVRTVSAGDDSKIPQPAMVCSLVELEKKRLFYSEVIRWDV